MITPEDSERWRQWALEYIGGEKGRIEAASQAALNSAAEGQSHDEIVAAAFLATAAWDYTHRVRHERTARRRSHFKWVLLLVFNVIVAIIVIAIIVIAIIAVAIIAA